jgi:hypothetical protein
VKPNQPYNQIDLKKRFHIESVSLFHRFDQERYLSAISIPQVAERLLNSCHFAGKIDVEDSTEVMCGLVRASISELVSVEELPQVKAQNCGAPFYLSQTEHPLLCIVKELRNVQMHLSSIEMNKYDKEMFIGDPEKLEEAEPIIKRICFIDNLNIEQFKSLRNYNRYMHSEFSEALKWFDKEQKYCGISTLLIEAAYSYAESLSKIIDAKKS